MFQNCEQGEMWGFTEGFGQYNYMWGQTVSLYYQEFGLSCLSHRFLMQVHRSAK